MADSVTTVGGENETLDSARAILLAELAGELIRRQLADQAEPVLRFALTLDPACFAARFALSEALSVLERTPEALEQGWLAYAAARRFSPPDLLPLAETEVAEAMLATVREPAPDAPTLAPALALCAAQRPDEAWLLAKIAALYLASGAAAEAVLWYRRAAARDDGFAPALAAALAECGEEPGRRYVGIADSRLLDDALRRIGLDEDGEMLCEPLAGGGQNQMVKVATRARSYALRLEKFPASTWYFYAEELHNADLAHRAGIAPELFYFDAADGTALMEFLPGAILTDKSFAEPDIAAAAGALYRRLHAVAGFHGRYDILAMIEIDAAARAGFSPPEIADLAVLAAHYDRLAALLRAVPAPPCATHNDPIAQNFILCDDRLVLLDWQCSALSDPHWEIAAFSAQNALPHAAEQSFFGSYFAPDDRLGLARTRLMKPVCSFFWLGRALIRGKKETDSKWREEATGNARRMSELLAEPVFEESVAIVEAAKA